MYIGMMCASVVTLVLVSLGTLLVGLVAGYWLFNLLVCSKINKNKTAALKIIEDAYAEAKTIKKEATLEAKDEAQKLKEEATKDINFRREELKKSDIIDMVKKDDKFQKEISDIVKAIIKDMFRVLWQHNSIFNSLSNK